MAGEQDSSKQSLERSADDAAAQAIAAADAALQTIARETGAEPAERGGRPLALPDLAANGRASTADPLALGLLDDVTLRVKIELGRTQMYVEDILRLNANSVVELDKAAGDPVDIFVNDRHVARGEVLVLNDNFCVRVSEILRPIGAEEDA